MSLLFALLLSETIDLENRVARLPQLVAELADEAKLDLAVAKELGNELVYVRARPRAAADWMLLIAEATCAEWEQDGKTRRLVRSPGLKRRLEAEELQELADRATENAPATIGAPNPAPMDPSEAERAIAAASAVRKEAQARVPNVGGRLIAAQTDLIPSWRLMRRLLTPDLIRRLAATPLQEITYWSSAKHPMRKPLPVSPNLLKQYNQERALLVQTFGAGKTEQEYRRAVADTSDYIYLPQRARPAVGVTLRVARYSATSLQINLSVLDAEGEEIETFGPTISLDVPRSTWPGINGLDKVAFPSSAPLKELLDGLDRSRAGSPSFRAKALDPVGSEPGDLYLRPILDAVCAKTGTEAVLGIPDTAIQPTLAPLQDDLRLADSVQRLEALVKWRTAPGLIVGHPRYPVESTRTRLDRPLLRDLLVRLNEGGAYRLEIFADYVAKQNPDAGASLLEWQIIGVSRAAHEHSALVELLVSEYAGLRDILRLYGLMALPQRRALWAGEPVPAAQLPVSAQQSLYRRIFRRYVSFETTLPDPPRPDTDAPAWLPGGIPASTVLHSRIESNPGVLVVDGPQRGYVLSTDSMASSLVRQRAGEEIFVDLSKARLSPVELRRLALSIRFSPEVSVEHSLIDLPPLGPANVTYANLPADLRRRVDEKAEAIAKARNAPRGNSKVPPPM